MLNSLFQRPDWRNTGMHNHLMAGWLYQQRLLAQPVKQHITIRCGKNGLSTVFIFELLKTTPYRQQIQVMIAQHGLRGTLLYPQDGDVEAAVQTAASILAKPVASRGSAGVS